MNIGIKSILSYPLIYDFLQNLIGSRKTRTLFVDTYVRAKPGDFILDIGCGTAQIIKYLPPIKYFGFDHNPKYIREAKKRYGKYASFRCEDVNTETLNKVPVCDIVLASGVFHHLNDDEAIKLLRLAKKSLKNNGRLVMIDPCYVQGQSIIAKFLIGMDRGQNVRTEKAYHRLATTVFSEANTSILHNITRVPYTHIIMECTS